MKSITLLFIIFFGISNLVKAQNDILRCEMPEIQQNLVDITSSLKEVSELDATSSNFDRLLSVVQQAEAQLSDIQLNCNELAFQGTNAVVIGPIQFQDGTYRTTVTTNGFFSAEVQTVSGTCTAPLANSLFTLFQGQANNGAEVIFTARDCTAIISVQNVTDNWILSFQPMIATQPIQGQDSAEINDVGNLVTYNQSIEGFLFANSDTEYFFDGNVRDTVTISATRTSGTADLLLQLYTPDGNLLFEDDDSNPNGFLNPQITNIPLPISGRYKIRITRCSFCDSTDSAGFTLSVGN